VVLVNRYEDLLRRARYARAELTPGSERRRTRRAAYEARYGPCVGDVEGVVCPLHGRHESSPEPEMDTTPTPLGRVLFWVPVVLMLTAAVVAVYRGWPLWEGALSIILLGPVLSRVLYKARDWAIERQR
jgi:hypothetical protein